MRYCLLKSEIDQDYKYNYKFYKRGMTSILLEYDSNNLLLFTRDYIKTEYLTQYLNFELVDSYFSNKICNPILKDTLINIIKVPKLIKPPIKEHNKLMKIPKKVLMEKYYFNTDSIITLQNTLSCMLDELPNDHILTDYIHFLSNFDKFRFDIKRDSILKNPNTNQYYIIDFVIPTEFVKIIHHRLFR